MMRALFQIIASLSVAAVMCGGAALAQSLAPPALPQIPDHHYYITNYGAIGDGAN